MNIDDLKFMIGQTAAGGFFGVAFHTGNVRFFRERHTPAFGIFPPSTEYYIDPCQSISWTHRDIDDL